MNSQKEKKKINKAKKPEDMNFFNALAKGDIWTRMSCVLFGLGNFRHRQIGRGLVILTTEVACVLYMLLFGFKSLVNMVTLGTVEQEEVFNEAKGIYEYTKGDNSMLYLLYGVITLFVIAAFIVMMNVSVKSAYGTQYKHDNNKYIPTFRDDIKSLFNEKLHATLLFFPLAGVIIFTIVPLVFMILIAFTNYDRGHQPPGNLFDWVGFANFKTMLAGTGNLTKTFWPLLGWTLIWAVIATFSCYILGMILALIINRKDTKFKSFWRFIFVTSIAVPQFVSLLTMKTIFNANGPMNVLLRSLHIIDPTTSLPFLADGTWAKVTILVVNLWIGIPFTMLNTTGILQNIPAELYEAAKVDGANAVVTFFKITLPYMLFVTAPYLITQFVGNINNFNVIFLLSGGGPDKLDYYYAGETDLLITWLYKLTITQKDYSLGSVIGILVFVIMATLSLITYHRTGAYKDEEAFQ